MYYITLKTSETGKRFTEVAKLMDIAWDALVEFTKSVGAVQFRMHWCDAYGGISAVDLPKEHDKKGWKEMSKRGGEYIPDKRTKLGKDLQRQIDALPTVPRYILNNCIGWKNSFNLIGFNRNSELYFGFTTKDNWDIKIPEDCTEVTSTEYKNTFKSIN